MNARYSKEIDRLYLQMYAKLFEYARSSLDNDAMAEEAVQDTFAIACQKPESLCSSPNPEGWLVITLKNVISNTLRSQNAAKRILIDYIAANSSELTTSNDLVGLEILYDNIKDLEEFGLLKERVLEGKSYLRLAKERGISVASCRKRMQRAKELLRKKIEL